MISKTFYSNRALTRASDTSHWLLDGLNEAQQQAISLPQQGHALIIAGAGSGKTRVLTHRIAWLITSEAVKASQILAVNLYQ